MSECVRAPLMAGHVEKCTEAILPALTTPWIFHHYSVRPDTHVPLLLTLALKIAQVGNLAFVSVKQPRALVGEPAAHQAS